jgi:signal transduction histidine kinase
MAILSQTPTVSEGQAALRRLAALGMAVVVLVAVGVAALLVAGSRELDALKAREDRALVGNVIDRRLVRMVTDLTTVTVWNQAYETLRPGGDPTWMDEEIGSYLAGNREHDLTVALDARGRPFYAWRGSDRADPATQGAFLAAAAPVIERARALEAVRNASARALPPSDPGRAEKAAGIILFEGAPYYVGASTVTPENATVPRAGGRSVLLVSAQRLPKETPALVESLGVEGFRIEAVTAPAPAAVVLNDPDGRPVGRVAWTQRSPGLAALEAAAPALVLGSMILLGVMIALGGQIWRVVGRLQAHERGLGEALRDLETERDRAESANVAKSHFLANMSHEIRTPLNGVLGMAQVLARSDLSPADHEKVRVIRASGETLLGLLNDLLDLSKIEAGRMEIEAHDFDLETEVETATRSFGALAQQKDVSFLVDVQPAARGVWRGDAGRIRQVLANPASNAVKFTDDGEVRMVVRRTAEGVACTVSDTGVGIARDRLDRLFQRFSQVDSSATRRFGGTGLGLAISRELAELMGGRVTATSVEGRGSAFTVELPLTWVGPSGALEAPAAAEPELPPIRVLAAEDNRTNQLLLTAMLEPLGLDLRVVADGREAVDAFRDGSFDVVLMDIQMPGMNGVDATRAIRAIEAEKGLRPTPILALSANVMRHQIEEYLAAGMNGFVAKPIEMTVLIASSSVRSG